VRRQHHPFPSRHRARGPGRERASEPWRPIWRRLDVRNAIARFNQTEFESQTAKERARRKILSAAKKHDIEVAEDSNIRKPTRSLRAAATKRGPSGGRQKSD
jgi:hypothetical protein